MSEYLRFPTPLLFLLLLCQFGLHRIVHNCIFMCVYKSQPHSLTHSLLPSNKVVFSSQNTYLTLLRFTGTYSLNIQFLELDAQSPL